MEKQIEKKEYAAAEMEVVELEKQDVLTYSPGGDIYLPDIPVPTYD